MTDGNKRITPPDPSSSLELMISRNRQCKPQTSKLAGNYPYRKMTSIMSITIIPEIR